MLAFGGLLLLGGRIADLYGRRRIFLTGTAVFGLASLLSVGAGYGVMVAVFQYGWGEGLLNFQSNGGVAQWLPIFMFAWPSSARSSAGR